MISRAGIGALFAIIASTQLCLAADPRYPDWPCAQAKVPEISLAAVWAGPPLGDAEVLGVLQKMIKQRQESVELYDKGGRAELAAQEREDGFAIGHHDEAFHLRSLGQVREVRHFGDGFAAGRVELLRQGFGVGIVNRGRRGM